MSARLLAVVLGLVALVCGCDAGSDSDSSTGPPLSSLPPAESSERPPDGVPAPAPTVPDNIPDVSVDDFLPEVVEMCRGAYGQLPGDEQAATTEDAFVVECLAAVSGRPDPLTGAPS